MSAPQQTAQRGGIGFVGLLTIAFVVLKLVGVISWPWVWVLAPLWISAILSLALVALIVIGAIVWTLFSRAYRKGR